jgi:hypothetical protein
VKNRADQLSCAVGRFLTFVSQYFREHAIFGKMISTVERTFIGDVVRLEGSEYIDNIGTEYFS